MKESHDIKPSKSHIIRNSSVLPSLWRPFIHSSPGNMVGVPGRSKACNTCRQRKVACSLERPGCKTCIKASRICSGYQRERVFILGPGTAYQGSKKKKASVCINGGRELSIRHKKKRELILRTECDSSQDSITPTGPIAQIRPLSSNSVYRQQVLSEFLVCSVPAAYGHVKERSSSHWLWMLPALPEYTRALEASILAVSTAKLGRLSDNPVLLHESLKFYVQGLWELQKALWDPSLMHKDETLAACMAMIMYEVVECPDCTIDAWASHMKGCAKLFEFRGPKAYTSDFSHQLFLSFRIIEIQQAFAERRPTFLAQTQWVDLPFKNQPKSTLQQLLDLVATVPNIIADGYQMLQDPLEGKDVVDSGFMLLCIMDLINRCWKVDSQLHKFYKNLEEETLGPVYWPVLSSENIDIDTDTLLGKVFPVSFEFLDLRTAHICLIYWASVAILWSGMGYTYRLLAGILAANSVRNTAASKNTNNSNGPQSDMNQLPPLGHRTDVATLARNICQSIEFCLGDEHYDLGARAAVFPLKVAIETLHDAPGCERELVWAQAAMAKVNRRGIRIMNHLPEPMTNHAFLPG